MALFLPAVDIEPAASDCIDYGAYMQRVGGLSQQQKAMMDIAVSGTYAYVAGSDSHTFTGFIFVLNISDPAQPVIENTLNLSQRAFGIFISGSFLYVANEFGGLRVYSISSPGSPQEIGSIDTPGYAVDVVVAGSYAYVADYHFGLEIFDVSNPASPTMVGNLDTPGYAQEISLSGNYVFVADGAAGLEAIDISNPAVPTMVGTLSNSPTIYAVTTSGSYAYVTDSDFGLRIVDITNPLSMAIVGEVRTPGGPDTYLIGWTHRGVTVSGQLAYVADGYGGLQVIDISNPSAPTIVGGVGSAGGWYVALVGSYAYTTFAGGLSVVDISNPTNPPYLGSVETYLYDLTLSGSHAYVAGNSFKVMDISDPSAPAVLGELGSPITSASGVAVSGSYAYVTDPYGYDPDSGSSGFLRIIDISNPASPTLVANVHSTGGAHISGSPMSGIAVSGDYVYVACPNGGLTDPGQLQVVDVSRPTRPSTVATVPVEFPCYSVALSGSYAFVTGYKETMITYPIFQIMITTGLRVIEISDPTSPVIVGSLTIEALGGTPTAQHWFQVAVAGNYLYVAGDVGLQVIDVSNPASPAIVATNSEARGPRDVAIQGSNAYLVGQKDFQVVDILNPLSPTTKGFGYFSGGTNAVVANASHLFVGGGLDGDPDLRGLFVLPLQCSSSPCTVELAALDIDPNTIASTGHGPQISAHIELPAPYDPTRMLLETVRLNGTVAPSSTSLVMKDWNHNGVSDAEVEFPRDAVEATLGEGNQVPVTVTGSLDDGCLFTGTANVRVIRPHVSSPNGGETYSPGEAVVVRWDNPNGWPVNYAQAYFSSDGGSSWSLIADHLQGTTYQWTVPSEPTQSGKMQVVVLDDAGVMGYDSSDGPFVIGSATTGIDHPIPTVHRLYQNSPNPFESATRVAFDLPRDGDVYIKLFDLTGREVRVLADNWYPAGNHQVSWDGLDTGGKPVGGGIYFLHMKAGSFSDTKRVYLRR